MPKFITIGYGDQAGYERTPKAVRDAAHEQDAKLSSEGALIGIAGKAASMEEAIEKVSHVPCAVAHGVVEVWPLD